MGGEKATGCRACHHLPGSPPHGRGKAVKLILSGSTDRITPAWAGKSGRDRENGKRQQDHPRMGGEKFSIFLPFEP